MPSPFPGMDPYLENPALWPGVHNRLIAAIDEDLSSRLLPRYFVEVEERVYVTEPPQESFVGRPDIAVIQGGAWSPPAEATTRGVAPLSPTGVLAAEVPVPDYIRETYLLIREAGTGQVIAAIEVLSPANKRPGAGRNVYEAKRLATLGTLTHLVEIDLVRAGTPPAIRVHGQVEPHALPGDYRVLIARGDRRPRADLLPFTVRSRAPTVPVPLRDGESVPVDLQAIIQTVYDRAGYGLRLDYRQEPVPPLRPEDAAWADALLRARGLR